MGIGIVGVPGVPFAAAMVLGWPVVGNRKGESAAVFSAPPRCVATSWRL